MARNEKRDCRLRPVRFQAAKDASWRVVLTGNANTLLPQTPNVERSAVNPNFVGSSLTRGATTVPPQLRALVFLTGAPGCAGFGAADSLRLEERSCGAGDTTRGLRPPPRSAVLSDVEDKRMKILVFGKKYCEVYYLLPGEWSYCTVNVPPVTQGSGIRSYRMRSRRCSLRRRNSRC
jgi:hypothetical protein